MINVINVHQLQPSTQLQLYVVSVSKATTGIFNSTNVYTALQGVRPVLTQLLIVVYVRVDYPKSPTVIGVLLP